MEYDEVIILPDSLATSVPAKTFRNTSLIILFIAILLIIGLLMIAVRMGKRYYVADPEYKPPSLKQKIRAGITRATGIHSLPGEANTIAGHIHDRFNGDDINDDKTCEKSQRSYKNGDYCVCRPPFWGRSCERESHGSDYYAVGDYPFLGEPFPVHRKAFPFSGNDPNSQILCEKLCNDDQNCIGYQYENKDPDGGINNQVPSGLCFLLNQVPSGVGNGFNEHRDANTYLAKNKRPQFPNTVILYKGQLRRRFWLEQNIHTNQYKIVNLHINQVNRIDWVSDGIINDGQKVIVVADHYFTPKEGKEITLLPNTPSGWYVCRSGQEYNPPYSIVAMGNNYWIMATDKIIDEINTPKFDYTERSVSPTHDYYEGCDYSSRSRSVSYF